MKDVTRPKLAPQRKKALTSLLWLEIVAYLVANLMAILAALVFGSVTFMDPVPSYKQAATLGELIGTIVLLVFISLAVIGINVTAMVGMRRDSIRLLTSFLLLTAIGTVVKLLLVFDPLDWFRHGDHETAESELLGERYSTRKTRFTQRWFVFCCISIAINVLQLIAGTTIVAAIKKVVRRTIPIHLEPYALRSI